jgi:hypothetical protein
MPAYVVQINREGGQSFTNGRDALLIYADSAAGAKSVAKNVKIGSGYSPEMWDAATVTEIAAAADLEGFRLRVAIYDEDIDVTVTGAAGDDIDDLGTDMATALNALPGTPVTASYDADTNVLIAAVDGEVSGPWAVELLPPLSDTIYENPTTPLADFITGVTATGGSNEVQTLTAADAIYGTYTITYSGQTTSAIAYNANAATVQAALEALSNLAPGDVVVTGTSIVTGLTLTFGGTLAGDDVDQITATVTGLVLLSATTTTAGVAAIDEVQEFDLGAASAGTFTITYAGQTTSAIAYDADAATVETALLALSNLAPGDVVCGGGALPGTPVTLTFGGTLAGTNVAQITIDSAGLTGATVTIATTTAGVAAVDEVQSIDVRGYSGGNFTITYSGQTTGNIARNASAATIDTALEALSNIGAGDVLCAGGPLGTAPVTVTFQSALAATNVAQMTLADVDLTAPAATIATSTIGGDYKATLVNATPPQAYEDPGLGQ